jgi:antitoxin component YwqK of YwqJK toxin-antitoxin module
MKIILFLFALMLTFFSCTQQNSNSNKINKPWLDSIVKNSDSSYSKFYYRSDFVTANYYINKKDSSVCQIMKDSAGIIRQIIIAKKNTRIFFGSYYKNGQLQADLPLDEFGQYHGTGIFYYENGSVQSSGSFNHGLKSGEWKVYDQKGKIMATDSFDKNGQFIQPQQP